jgi:NADPH2:quinone reductase
MIAAVTIKSGDPNSIQVKEVPTPKVKTGWVLIEVKAFELNRSKLFTRRSDSRGVSFPKIQGIECVGIIKNDTSNKYRTGQQVASIMGGLGRSFYGGYAEYCLVPLPIVSRFKSSLPWSVLGIIPEKFRTVSG